MLNTTQTKTVKELKEKIKNKTVKIAVVGMGYVGLAVAEAVVKSDFKFIGYDIDPIRVQKIKSLDAKNIQVTSNINDIKDSDVILVCLPTPVKQYVHPDLSFIEHAINNLSDNVLKEGQLLIIESTVQPGTTKEYIVSMILAEKKSFIIGENFFVGYSPERVDPGNKQYSDIRKIPKLVSGVTENCLLLTEAFYSSFIEKVHRTSSPEIAEFAKLFENTFRAVNIAFVDEMTRIANRLNMNISEALAAAYTKPFGIMPFWPSVGVGGHCIPVDLLYLDSWARTNDCYSQFVELTHRINQGMPYYVMQRIGKILNEDSKSFKGSRLLLIGATYKPNISDIRTSASIKLAQLLVDAGSNLSVYDPYISEINVPCKLLVDLKSDTIRNADLVILSVAHSCLDLDLIYKNSNKILECAGKPVFPLDRIDRKIYRL